VAVTREITARKRAEERLREFGRVVENLEEQIAVVDPGVSYVIANRAYQAILQHCSFSRPDSSVRPVSRLRTDTPGPPPRSVLQDSLLLFRTLAASPLLASVP